MGLRRAVELVFGLLVYGLGRVKFLYLVVTHQIIVVRNRNISVISFKSSD